MGQNTLATSQTQVITLPVTSDVTAGDYFYQWGGTNFGWPKPANVSAAPETFSFAGASRTFSLVTASARSASLGPYLNSVVYSGATVAVNTVTTAITDLGTAGSIVSKAATLTNGNVAVVYMSATNTLSSKIFDASGTQVGSTLSISTTCAAASGSRLGQNYFSVAALSTGGFVVAFRNSSTTFVNIATVSSSNALVSGPTVIAAARQFAADCIRITGNNSGGYLLAFVVTGSSTVYSALYDSSNTSLGGVNYGFTVNSGYATVDQREETPVILEDGTMCLLGALRDNDGAGTYVFNASRQILNAAGTSVISGSGAGGTGTSNALDVYSSAVAIPGLNQWYLLINEDSAIRVFTGNASSILTSTGVSGSTTERAVGLTSSSLGNFAYYIAGSNVIRRSFAYASGTINFATGQTIAASLNSSYGVTVAPLPYKDFICATQISTSRPAFLIAQKYSVTNGEFFLGSERYTPLQGYFLRGIALESATAGQFLCGAPRHLAPGTLLAQSFSITAGQS